MKDFVTQWYSSGILPMIFLLWWSYQIHDDWKQIYKVWIAIVCLYLFVPFIIVSAYKLASM